MQLENRVVMITGGTEGLGLATAERLVEHGAHVAICGRDKSRLDRAVSRLSGRGPDVLGLQVDVTDASSLAGFFNAVEQKWGRLDGLINGAGHHTGSGFEGVTDEQWQQDFELKLLAAVRGSRHAIALMAGRGGCIVNTLSIWARTPEKGSMPSSVFRAAGLALTKGLANDYADKGIRANAILVGFVDSNQWGRAAETAGLGREEYMNSVIARMNIPLGRIGASREFADLACFLLSPTSGYITGAAVPLDGGLSRAI